MSTPVYTITVADSGRQFPCPADEFVLKAMIRAGGPIVHGCCGGGCGVCRMKIDSGDYSVVKRMSSDHICETDRQDNIVLLCCVKPCGDLTLSAVR